ncbi:hypothetical protein ETU09_05785 [Apibacter muscae]|uniref:Uncharacterized protein n=1 Tax=Apibacter muscae TaxID=2509004 RepID=A0A563DF92_9FLAO|nr:hypothetical protein [Apibacter muscae]TWP28434.1 hypothetical protein ETU09_05785 [Apibacter muscae]
MNVLYIPEGIENLKNLFSIDFKNVKSWKVRLLTENDEFICTSRNNIAQNCNEIRIHFINSLGEIDSIDFNKTKITQETKSESWKKSQGYPFERFKGGTYRKNIISNESYEAVTKSYSEHEQYWLKELMNSPKAWLEMQLPNGFLPSEEKAYIPIVITDSELIEKKVEQRYEYIVTIKFSMSNENINLR